LKYRKIIKLQKFNSEVIFNKSLRPFKFQKLERSFLLSLLLFNYFVLNAQNVLEKKIKANTIESILINGNQIFEISIETTTTDYISIVSKLDGEYQDNYQIVTKEEHNKLTLSLEFMSFDDIPDDKRNAHKVIAATLHFKIPEDLNLNIKSDIGSVHLNGNFNLLTIELLQGHCEVKGKANDATINTIDGAINVITESATIDATTNKGTVILDQFNKLDSIWNLTSINGNITVTKQE